MRLTVIAMTDDGCLWFAQTDDSGADATDMAVCTLVDDDCDIWTAVSDAIRLINKWCRCCNGNG